MIRHGYVTERLDGSTPPDQRQKKVDGFNSSPGIFAFLISTTAGKAEVVHHLLCPPLHSSSQPPLVISRYLLPPFLPILLLPSSSPTSSPTPSSSSHLLLVPGQEAPPLLLPLLPPDAPPSSQVDWGSTSHLPIGSLCSTQAGTRHMTSKPRTGPSASDNTGTSMCTAYWVQVQG